MTESNAKHNNKELELRKLMRRLKIYHKDIKEQFVRSSGPGGQNVNKVSTCVVLQHVPTGLTVKSQKERSQALNRYHAKYLLVQKIQKLYHDQKVHEIQSYEKRRRQNRKRPNHLKEEILRQKHITSDKKRSRQKINPHKADDI